ncbi:MAG: hypothetical protein ACREIT_07810, partial [Tepidisphaeraceae bacterium]
QKLGLKPWRDLKADMELTDTATSYAGTGSKVSLSNVGAGASKPAKPARAAKESPVIARNVLPGVGNLPTTSGGSVDFKKMTPAQKVAYNRARIQADLGAATGTARGARER